MTDAELIELLTERSEEAIKATQKEYGWFLYSITFRILKSRQDSEECVNDTLLKMWETIPPFIPKSLKGYIGAVARNTALDIYRKQNASKRNAVFTEVLDECSQCISDYPEEQLELNEISKCISTYLKSVKKEKQMMFIARYYHGYSIDDIVKKRNISEGKVKMTLSRMRKELKKYLEKEGVL